MENLQVYDIYDFVDDGVNESIYTILNRYHPNMKKDFSLANMLNHMVECGGTEAQVKSTKITYAKDFEKLAEKLEKNTKSYTVSQGKDKGITEERRNEIFEELKNASSEIPACKDFGSIKAYIDYAKNNIDNPDAKPLRDAIVNNAVGFLPKDEIIFMRKFLLKGIYLDRALSQAKKVNHKVRNVGDYPEVDKLQSIGQILMRKNGLQEYDDFYHEAQAKIRDAALKAMKKARIESVCQIKRRNSIRPEINPSISSNPKEAEELPISEMFDKLKRVPRKDESAWAYESLEKPELLCDLAANYSKDGIENQRVIAFRYGRLKYKDPKQLEGLNIDKTSEMPELIGISRIGNDGSKTYFVLMSPIDRLIFRPVGEKPQDPGEKPYKFTITQDVQVPTRSGLTKIERQTRPAEIVEEETGQKVNAFKNKDIPVHLKEFFAKVFFSDEYLSKAIENNARYIGNVVETDNGPQIRSSDVEKYDLAAAYYAAYHPGTIDRVPMKSFERYCSSIELELKHYKVMREYQAQHDKKKAQKKEDGAR